MSTQESSFDFIRWSHSKLFRSLSNGSARATVLWAAHSQRCSVIIHINQLQDVLITELRWKQTQFGMSPNFHNTLPSCYSIFQVNCLPFLRSSLFIHFAFRSVLACCQSKAPFLEANGVKSRMVGDAGKLGALGKILNDNVALQSFDASV